MEVFGIADVPSYLVFPVVIGILLYVHTRYKFSYWRKQGVPAVTALPMIGSLKGMFTKKLLHELSLENYRKYGRTYGMYEPSANMLIIAEPEDIKTVLIKDFDKFSNRRKSVVIDPLLANMLSAVRDEKWQAIRNVMSPTFSGSKLRNMMNTLMENSEELTNCFIDSAKTAESVDPKRLFAAFTMDVIANTAFRTKINSLKNPDNEFMKHAEGIFKVNFITLLVIFFPKLSKMFGLSFTNSGDLDFFTSAVRKIIKMRQGEESGKQDFLSILKESMEDGAFDETKQKPKQKVNPDEPWKKESKKFLTEEMIMAQCVTFFFAGYETTSTTLTFMAYSLALNPECQEKLIKEIDETSKKYGKLSYEAINEMSYLKAVMKETLRMYPPAIRLERETQKSYQLGDIYLKKGTLIGVPVYAIHYDSEFWPNPENFDPERFMGNSHDINPYTYLPFGIGRRNCVAMRFAELQIKVAMASVLSKLKFCRVPETSVPLTYNRMGAFLTPRELKLGVELL